MKRPFKVIYFGVRSNVRDSKYSFNRAWW